MHYRENRNRYLFGIPPRLLRLSSLCCFVFFRSFFFFNDTATTEIYTLSLHDALPISTGTAPTEWQRSHSTSAPARWRSEEHTSELQSRRDLVCRLLLEKKKKNPQ